MSNRENEENFEKIIAQWLDDHLYKRSDIAEQITCFRCTDRRSQIAGADVVYHFTKHPLGQYVIDEKCAMHYMQTDLHTFSFELSFQNRAGQRVLGWFTNKGKYKTTHYLLVYVHLNEEKFPKTDNKNNYCDTATYDDIESVDYIFLPRAEVQNWIEENIGMASIKQNTKTIIHSADIYGTGRESIPMGNGVKLSISAYLPERPVNIIIPLHILKAIGHFNTVTKEQI